jgi:hypothetical protein
MNDRTQDRLFAGCGIAFVVLDLVGAIIAMTAGKTHSLTISSTSAQVAHAIAKPAGTAVWIGGYLEVLSVGAFLAYCSARPPARLPPATRLSRSRRSASWPPSRTELATGWAFSSRPRS